MDKIIVKKNKDDRFSASPSPNKQRVYGRGDSQAAAVADLIANMFTIEDKTPKTKLQVATDRLIEETRELISGEDFDLEIEDGFSVVGTLVWQVDDYCDYKISEVKIDRDRATELEKVLLGFIDHYELCDSSVVTNTIVESDAYMEFNKRIKDVLDESDKWDIDFSSEVLCPAQS
jgi:hypothetical protein